jgi:uncharacterized membrane protein
MSGVHGQPDGPAFDIVLLLHVACVVAGLASMVTSAATAARLRRLLGAAAPLPDAVVRYFRPGVNWVGRSIYGIPVFGFALLAMSRGAYALADGWVAAGLAVFVVVALLGEGVLWPAERRLQGAVGAVAAAGAEGGDGAGPPPGRDAQLVVWSATVAIALLVVGTVLMVAQP